MTEPTRIRNDYANSGACSCIKCGSWFLDRTIKDFGNIHIIVRKQCQSCGTTWHDHFEFSRYEMKYESKPNEA